MILLGDALKRLRDIPDCFVDTCVTSPPYWNLRDYGVKGQLGLEKNPELYVEKMVEIFREVRRVLKKDGTLWLNLGDSYIVQAGGTQGKKGARANRRHSAKITGRAGFGLKKKDLAGIPWRVAFALQADGWYFRQDIVWAKPAPMPESIRDRCTKSHEYMFLLSKSQKYHFDAKAIQEPCSENTHDRMARVKPEHEESLRAHGGEGRQGRSMGPRVAGVNPKAVKIPSGWDTGPGDHKNLDGRYPRPKQNESFQAATVGRVEKRNKRSVWTVAALPFKEAHFATYPPELIEPCILAGARPGGIVLDPFLGSGTTGMVALKHGRKFIGIELNPKYLPMAVRRIYGDNLDLFPPEDVSIPGVV